MRAPDNEQPTGADRRAHSDNDTMRQIQSPALVLSAPVAPQSPAVLSCRRRTPRRHCFRIPPPPHRHTAPETIGCHCAFAFSLSRSLPDLSLAPRAEAHTHTMRCDSSCRGLFAEIMTMPTMELRRRRISTRLARQDSNGSYKLQTHSLTIFDDSLTY